ncbi:AAA family ATPase [uncultured Cohaesibacter sp.]|uniref:AAA family ATPase n=1 Tax=uncultured Cohaesibacter sp. TaxID=1002546 RepID=UPI002AABF0C2|nr:AAA family ATPase [uncultured Cohaesibacter sp.]
MYLQRVELVNTGPIEHVKITCRFGDDGSPKPVVFVGQNGSGKSVATAHVVNALIAAHGTVFEDSDVEKGKVYKLRSPTYIRHGAEYSTAEVHLSNNFSVYEAQFAKQKSLFVEPHPTYTKWNEVPATETTHYTSNFTQQREELKTCLKRATHLFFPPNRFEEPAWLNEINLRNKASYASLKNYSNYSNRPIVNYAPMRDLQNWLLDLVYDSFALERRSIFVPGAQGVGQNSTPQLVETRNGPATQILVPIESFLRTLFGKPGKVTWSIGARNDRQIGISIDNELMAANLFQLSTGQAVLFDLFLAIIRDFDLSASQLTQLSDIEGIVVVDEIDLHLHTDLQHDLLPNLIRLFPKVQFILTTHSPLFLIGMEKIFTSDGFQLIELPDGQEIEVERFSEFDAAYKHMQDSARFQDDVRNRIEANQKPVLYLEGTTDIDYLTKAGELLGRTELLDSFELVDAVGYSHLNKIWDTYKSHLGATIQKKWLLLYDCDADKSDSNCGNLYRRTITQQPHKITSGIENLFSDETIQRAIDHKLAFVDVKQEHSLVERGVERIIPETWKINKDEKRNLCDYLCENGTADDFSKFSLVFDVLEEVMSANSG